MSAKSVWKDVLNYGKQLDVKVSSLVYAYGRQHITNRFYLKATEYSVNGMVWLVMAVVCLYSSPNNPVFANLLSGLVLDIIYVAILKALCRRRRPPYALADTAKRDTEPLPDKHSFPSGHASRATYLALYLANRGLISLVVSVWAIAVCASRVLLGRHHLADVVGSALLGYLAIGAQFTILSPINTLLIKFITMLMNGSFSDAD